MAKIYIDVAKSYENEVYLSQKYPDSRYLPTQVARYRAWTCWSAAVSAGIVVC